MTDLTREQLEAMLEAEDDLMLVGTHNLARQLLATMTERDEAQAAQAGVMEKIRDHTNKAFVHVYDTAGRMLINKHTIINCLDDIALADPTGVKMLDELRQREENLAIHAANLADQLAEAKKREAWLRRIVRAFDAAFVLKLAKED